MDYIRLFLYVVIAISSYSILGLAMKSLRLHIGRIIQFGAIALLAFLSIRHPDDPRLLFVCIVSVLLFTIIPSFIDRAARGLLYRNNPSMAARLYWIKRFLVWDRTSLFDHEVARAFQLGAEGDFEEQQEIYDRILQEDPPDYIKNRIREYQLIAYSQNREWEKAIECFDDLGDIQQPVVLASIVRAYAEMGQFSKGMHCLRRLESYAKISEIRPGIAIARVYLFALMGDLDRLQQTFDRYSQELRDWPAQAKPYWLGRCYAAAGDKDAAIASYEEARSALPQSELDLPTSSGTMWRAAIDDRIAEAPSAASHHIVRESLYESQLGELDTRPSRVEQETEQPPRVLKKRATVTIILIVAIAVVWLITEWLAPTRNLSLPEQARRLSRLGANDPQKVEAGEYWRFTSSMFLHANWIHLLINGYALYILGAFVETLQGKRKMFVFFTLSGIIGSLASYLSHRNPPVISVGASGGVLGLFGAALMVVVKGRRLFPRQMRRNYLIQFVLIIILNLALGFTIKAIDNAAHIGGLLAGIFMSSFAVPSVSVERRRGGDLILNLAFVAALGALCYSGFKAVENVWGGGLANDAPLEVYQNPQYNYEIGFPAGWERQEDREIGPKAIRAVGGFGVEASISVQPLVRGSLDFHVANDIKSIEASRYISLLDVEGPRTVRARYTFIACRLRFQEIGKPVKIGAYYFLEYGGDVYTISFIAPEKRFQDYTELFQKILGSFKIVE